MSYATVAEVREAGTAITTSAVPPAEDSLVNSIIERASRFFDLVCGVPSGYFEAAVGDAEATNKTLYGDGTNYLKLPPYVAGSLDTDLTFPGNYTALTFIERDGYLVRADSNGILIGGYNSSYPSGWYQGVPIVVSAIWGYEQTPADVKHAVIELVINLFRETDPASSKLVNLETAPIREKLPPRVAEIARRYRVKEAKGAFV